MDMNHHARIGFFGLLIFSVAPIGLAQTLYVDQNAPSTQLPTGNTWQRAYTSLQDALHRAKKGDVIWVAQGTYKPTTTHERSATFQLKPYVSIYGGFTGRETELKQRNWNQHPTILSGQINKSTSPIKNSYHVVTGANHARLDGFIIRDGYASTAHKGIPTPSHQRHGWSLPLHKKEKKGQQHTTPQAIENTDLNNLGGGLLNFHTAPHIAHCQFIHNHAIKGGGVYNLFPKKKEALQDTDTVPTFTSVVFKDNFAKQRGGGMANDLKTNVRIQSAVFIHNKTNGKGGGIYNDFSSSPKITNSLFVSNYARISGGGIANDGSSSPLILNCTLTKNAAGDLGGGIYNGTYAFNKPSSSPTIVNTILWHNITLSGPAEISNWNDDRPIVDHCDIEGGYPGIGNLSKNPEFVNPSAFNFSLKEHSPCLQRGIRHLDHNHARFDGAHIHIGAYAHDLPFFSA